jgi:hypothetical protein
MPELRGLPGVKRPAVLARYASSRTDAVRQLRTCRAVTAAGDCGALNVWRDDKGKIRASFHRYLATIDEVSDLTRGGLILWLRTWWPRLHRVSNG